LTLDTKLPNEDWLPVFWTDLKQIDELTENEDYNMYFFRVSQQFVYLSVKYDLQDYIGIVLPRY
jgi:HEPN domain-containing protein